jgi:hypothetical protein
MCFCNSESLLALFPYCKYKYTVAKLIISDIHNHKLSFLVFQQLSTRLKKKKVENLGYILMRPIFGHEAMFCANVSEEMQSNFKLNKILWLINCSAC